MKANSSILRLIVMGACVVSAYALCAQEASYKRGEWLKKIGESVREPGVLQANFERVAPAEKVEFAQKVIRAASRLPVEPDEKGAVLVRSAIGLIGGVSGATKQQVIAEVFVGTPVEHLPVMTEELAKRFDQDHNKLTNEQYEQFASDTLDIAIKRNANVDMPSVRNTFVILAFLPGAKAPELRNKLIARLPDERQRNLAASWIPPALTDKNYDAMLAAADVEPVVRREDLHHPLVGHANLDRLLADLNANLAIKPESTTETEMPEASIVGETVWLPLSEVRSTGGTTGFGLSGSQLDHRADTGINRTPCGYQNQYLTITTSRPNRK